MLDRTSAGAILISLAGFIALRQSLWYGSVSPGELVTGDLLLLLILGFSFVRQTHKPLLWTLTMLMFNLNVAAMAHSAVGSRDVPWTHIVWIVILLASTVRAVWDAGRELRKSVVNRVGE
jgi:hypothetical protein